MSLREELAEIDEEMLFADGFADAIIGWSDSWQSGGQRVPRVVYDAQKCVEIIMERDGVSWEDAHEHFDFNVTGAYVGERTPIFVNRVETS